MDLHIDEKRYERENANIKKVILNLPAEIKEKELGVYELKKEVEKVKKDLSFIGDQIYKDVYDSFKNDRLRDVEVYKRMLIDPEAKYKTDMLEMLSKNLHTATIELNYLNNEFSSIKYLIKLMEVEK